MKISDKIGGVFILTLLMVSIGGLVGIYNASKITEVTRFLYSDIFKKTEILLTLEKEFLAHRQELFLHIIVADRGSKSFLESTIKDRRKKIKKLVEDYKKLGIDEKSRNILERFISNLSYYWDIQDTVIGVSAMGERDAAMDIERVDGNERFNNALDALKNLIEEENIAALKAYRKTEHLGKIILGVTLVFTLLGITVAGGLWWILSRSIARPIQAIEESARKLAEGDLKQRVNVVSNDEIGSLAREFNRMAESLEHYYETLEKKVKERTEELRIANEELYKKKKELEIKNEELARASQMKSQFLANVSHELRTPLNSIIGFSELLQDRAFGELNEKQMQYVKFIHSSGVHLLQLINSILDLSKIEAGRMEVVPEEFVLTEMLSEILTTIKPLAHKKNITIEMKDTPASPVIVADKAKFKQIMLNLLSNAVKFNVEGGKVTVDWDIREEPRGTDFERYLYISVEDTGIGIKDNDLDRIFKEFEQLEPTITREHGGTGLGLALTKKLVELHNGEIWVESEFGRGSRFTVKLPQGVKKIEVIKPEIDTRTVIRSGEDKPFILVAGESEYVNHLLEIYLTEEDYDVLAVKDGVELIEKAKEKKPFAVVMGIMLQGKKDGWEVLKELKSCNDTKDIPVVIISAANNKELGFALGAVDYLVKPVEKDRLLESLERLSFAKRVKREKLDILVVDDDPYVLDLLGDMLEKEGYRVLKADTGEKAIKMAIEREPSLIILDLMMPGTSGFDVVDKLKKHPVARNIPILIFTAKEITEEDKARLNSSIKKIITKASFSREELLSEIRFLELTYPEKANMLDRTTRIFNRRYFDMILSRELSRSEQNRNRFSILYIDIDNFEGFNKRWGLKSGDRVLREIANLLISNLRRMDYVTRYGGDEFTVLLPDTVDEEAYNVARKLKELVGSYRFRAKGEEDSITVSIALMTLPMEEDMVIMEELKRLVKKAYLKGGNRIAVYGRDGNGEEDSGGRG